MHYQTQIERRMTKGNALCACICLLLRMRVGHTASWSCIVMCWKQQLMQATLVELECWRCPHADATKAYLYTDHALTTRTIPWGTSHTHIVHGCLCLTNVSITCPKFLDGTHTSETDITNLRHRSDEADSCCSGLNSQHAHSSYFLTYVLTKHCHVFRWKGNRHEDKHEQH